ncbi:hypothetical protein PY365_24490 [Roseiarcaceae bacterium H3SJ34-1]|uniref:hypothetical protein n=1 Tax=Terripilifer ovatus TaxID=3032367 RepID=UPI003AB98163|nr:hypothetical protein [Roseiarcaceae bacterium H3SJ34-1]
MHFILKVALGLFLALGLAEAAPSQAAERVVIVQSRYAHTVLIQHPRQRLGQPLAEPRRVLHLAYFPRTYRGVAYVRGPHAYRRVYFHTRRYAHVRPYVRRHARVHKYRYTHRRWTRHAAACPVVNRFGIVVAFAPGC